MTEDAGISSRLKYVVDALEAELKQPIDGTVIAKKAGISRATIYTYMKPYETMLRIDIKTLLAIAKALEEIAVENGVEGFRVYPEDLVQFVGWTRSINKIEGLPMAAGH